MYDTCIICDAAVLLLLYSSQYLAQPAGSFVYSSTSDDTTAVAVYSSITSLVAIKRSAKFVEGGILPLLVTTVAVYMISWVLII